MLTQMRWNSYLVAVAATVGVAALRYLLNHSLGIDYNFFLPLTVAVMVAAWHGGFWVGLFATLLSMVGAVSLSMGIGDGWRFTAGYGVRLGLFAGIGGVISLFCELLHRYRRQAEADAAEAALHHKETEKEVAERRLAEAALRESETYARQLVESSSDCVKVLDLDGRLISINATGLKMLQVSDEATLLNKDWTEYWTGAARAAARQAVATARNGETASFLGVWSTSTGESRWWDVLLSPVLDSNRRPKHILAVSRDITERKRAEAELSNARFRHMADAAPAMLWVTEPDGSCPFLSRGWYEFTGQTEQEGLGKGGFGWLDAVHPEDREPVGRMFLEANEKREPYSVDYRLQRHDGEYCWALDAGRPRFGPNGEFLGYVGSVLDITERKRAEEAFKQSEERFGSFVRSTHDGIVTLDRLGLITVWNPGAEILFGYAQDEVLGKPMTLLMPERFRERHARGIERASAAGHLTAAGNMFELVGLRKDGTEFPIEISLSSWSTRNGVFFTGIVRDITERKQAEAAVKEQESRLRAIIDKALDAVVAMTEQGIIIDWNLRATAIFGWSREEAIGRELAETIVPLRYRDAHRAGLKRFLKTGEGPVLNRRVEITASRKDGTEVPVELAIACIKLGDHYQFSAFIEDISERKRVEKDLTQAKEAAEAANIAKSQFLANMSHEIRTPMNAIVGMADLLRETALSEDQREYVDRFSRAGASLLDLINDVLDFSKIEAGLLELDRRPFDVHDLIDRVAELLMIRAQSKTLEFVAFVDPAIPTWVLGDPVRLRQILINLVGNAIKFTDHGEVVIRVAPDTADPNRISFSVVDSGIGIPQDKLETIFEHFSQLDASSTRRHGGTGLGLVISRRLVRLMNGDISVSSVVGSGSTFSFSVNLPAVPAQPAMALPALAIQGLRVMVVDDHDTNRLVVREYLAQLGAVILEAAGGAEALELLAPAQRQGPMIDLAILDFQMPGMDGLELADAIRSSAIYASLPLVLYASDLRGDIPRQARDRGIACCTFKPISWRRLLESVAIALNQTPALTVNPDDTTAAPIGLPPLNILIAEDLEDNRDVIALFLKDTACRVEMADNGAVAVQKFQSGSYDLVLMDIQMPVMDGLQATEAIRQWETQHHRVPTPIVALTAHAFQEEHDKSFEAGCTAHLTKPIQKKGLLTAIRQYARQPSDQAA